MDASSLFGGGPPSVTPASGTVVASDEPPRSAASLFGGGPEEDPGSMRGGTAAEIQDMPDDLFGGDGGSGGFGSSPARPGPGAAAFGGAPQAPQAPPPPPVGGVPEGLFGGGGGRDNEVPSAFGFGGEYGGNTAAGDHHRVAGMPATAGRTAGGMNPGEGASPPPTPSWSSYAPRNDDVFGAPPPSADVSGSGGFGAAPQVDAFPSSHNKPAEASFGAPPSELFGGPPLSSSSPSPPRQAFGAPASPPLPSDASRSRHNSSPWGSQQGSSAAAASPPASSFEAPASSSRQHDHDLRPGGPFASDTGRSRAWSQNAGIPMPMPTPQPPPPPASTGLGSPPPAAAAGSGPSAPGGFGIQPPAAGGDLGSPPPSMFGAPADNFFGAPPPPPPPSAGGGRSPPPVAGGRLGSPPPRSAMFGAPPPLPGAFGAAASTADLGSPPSSTFGALSQNVAEAPVPRSSFEAGGPPSAAATVGSPPPAAAFGGPPEDFFGAQSLPPGSGAGGSPPFQAASSASPPGGTFGAAFGAPPPPSAAPALGSPPSTTSSGAHPPGGFGAQPPPTAHLGSPPSSMFGAPPREAFGAPPPSGSAAGGGSPPTSTTFGSPPPAAAAFGSPPPQETLFHAPSVPDAAAELGSPPASVFGAPPPQGGNPPAAPFSPPGGIGTGGSRGGGDAFGAKNDVFGSVGATPFGSPPGGVFGGDGGGGEDVSSQAWWESETGNDDQPSAGGRPSNGEKEGDDAASGVNASAGLGFPGVRAEISRASYGTQEGAPTTLEPWQGTPPPTCAEAAAAEDLGAPPADMFGTPPPAKAHGEAESAAPAPPQTVTPPLGQPPRPQAPPSRAADGDSGGVEPVTFSSSRPPYGIKVDVGDAEGTGSPAGVGGDRAGSGGEAWTDRTASPEWEKQPSPPLELGVFGAPPPPEDSVAGVGGAAGLFGAASASDGAAAGESAEGEGDHGGWGMCSADPEGAPASAVLKGAADTDTDSSTKAAAAAVSAAAAAASASTSTGHQSGPIGNLAHLSNPPRSSFVANDGTAAASVAALALGVAPSSPPRLFASRSASWVEKDASPDGPTGEKDDDYEGMFAGAGRKTSGDGSPPRGGGDAKRQGLGDTDETPDLAAGGLTPSPAMGELPALPPKTTDPTRTASPNLHLPLPAGSNTISERYSQGALPPFTSIPEAALDAQSPPRLRGRPEDRRSEEAPPGPAVEVTASSSSHARDGSSTGPAMATPESGGRVGAGSTLSTPFGALSRGSGTTPRTAEGFPSSEDGGVFEGPAAAEGSASEETDALGSAESPGRPRESDATPAPASVVAASVSADGDGGMPSTTGVVLPPGGDDAVVEEANGDGGTGAVSSPPAVVEGKEDGQLLRWAAPHAPAAAPAASAGEAARKVDADSALDGGDGDGWSDDDWDVDDDANGVGEARDVGGKEGSNEGAAGAAIVWAGDAPSGAAESGGESETNLFGSEASGGEDSWGGGEEEDGSGGGVEEEGEGSCSQSESESDLDSFSDNDLSNEASIAETTASDFFATPTSPESDLGSPRPRSTTSRKQSRASMSSLSPLSGYNSSGSRRKRRETSGGSGSSSVRGGDGGGGGGSSSVLSSTSPFSLAAVPPIFPLSVAPRPRRPSSAGTAPGLPPPVPVTHTYSAPSGSTGAAERSARSTWRSVSPSRAAGEDRGWSISPVLAARAGTSRNVVSPVMLGSKAGMDVAYASPPLRTGLGGGVDEQRDGGEPRARLPQPPAPPHVAAAPKREAGRAGGAADVAKLGRAMGALSTAPPDQPFGAQPPGVCEMKRDDPPKTPAGDGDTAVSEVPPEGDDIVVDATPSSAAAASSHDPCVGVVPGLEVSVEEVNPPRGKPGPSSAPAEALQTDPSPRTSSTAEQGWMAGLSEAAVPGAGEKGPGPAASCSGDLPSAGAAGDEVVGGNDDPRDISAAVGSDGSSAAGSPQRPPPTSAFNSVSGGPPPPSSAVPEALSLGVTAGPSPFVNTSSPLTRSRNRDGQEASMFDAFDDDAAGGGGGESEAGAADLFAAEAPARAADELFSSGPGAAADTAGGADAPGGCFANDTSVFSQGPPPETAAVPPPSLPNPWGSSPLKQPLPEPKRWPTKGGTGFDRPLTPLAATQKVSEEAGPPQAGGAGAAGPGAGVGAGAEAGEIPSAFFGPGSGESGDDDGGFGGAGAGAGGDPAVGGGPEGQALQNSPVAGPLPGMPTARPWGSGSGVSNTGAPGGGLGEASRTSFPAPPAAPAKLSSSRFGAAGGGGLKGFSGRGEVSGGGAWGGNSALAAAAAAAAATPVVADRAPREPGVTPAGVIASFGFGGKLVAMHPRRKIKLAPAPGVPPTPDDGPTLRKGPVNVWSLKDVAGPEAVVRDAESFPGPASSAPIEAVKEYVEKRAASGGEGERLLWSVAGLALQFKGCLTSDAGAVDPKSPEAGIVKLLKAAHARRKEATAAGAAAAAAAAANAGGATSGAAAAAAKASTPFAAKGPAALSSPGTRGPQGHLFRPGQRIGAGGFAAGAAAAAQQHPFSPVPAAAGPGVGPFGGISAPGQFGSGAVGLGGGHRAAAVPAAASAAAAAAGRGAGEGGLGEPATGTREEVEALLVDGKKEEVCLCLLRARGRYFGFVLDVVGFVAFWSVLFSAGRAGEVRASRRVPLPLVHCLRREVELCRGGQ